MKHNIGIKIRRARENKSFSCSPLFFCVTFKKRIRWMCCVVDEGNQMMMMWGKNEGKRWRKKREKIGFCFFWCFCYIIKWKNGNCFEYARHFTNIECSLRTRRTKKIHFLRYCKFTHFRCYYYLSLLLLGVCVDIFRFPFPQFLSLVTCSLLHWFSPIFPICRYR